MGNWVIPPPVSILSMTLNLVLGLVLSLLVAWHYSHFGESFANRYKFALLLPALTLTTAIVITIVKSSLALSLGLVGALSIVRFRTAIKDPEELIFLFISITIGLGIGAEQNIPTVIGVLLLLAYMGVKVLLTRKHKESNMYINIFMEQPEKPRLDDIQACISSHVALSDFRRFDSAEGQMQVTFLIDIDDTHQLNNLVEDLHQQFPITEISFLKQES